MINLLKRNWGNITTMIGGLITILGIVSTIYSAVLTFNCNGLSKEKAISYIVIVIVLLIILVKLIYSNIKLKNKWNGLILLAHRGHIHTIRMILMRDYQYTHLEGEVTSNGINRTNNFCVETAEFSFSVSEQENRVSNVQYMHKFKLKSKIKHNSIFNPWVFGENGSKPKDCYVQIGKNKMVLVPYAVKNLFVNYPVEESIYAVECGLGNNIADTTPDDTITFSYKRDKCYDWLKGGTFVVYPKCYANKINKASFKCEFKDKVSYKLSIRLTELSISGSKPKEIVLPNFMECIEREKGQEKFVYKTEKIKINVDNIYIIKIVMTENSL